MTQTGIHLEYDLFSGGHSCRLALDYVHKTNHVDLTLQFYLSDGTVGIGGKKLFFIASKALLMEVTNVCDVYNYLFVSDGASFTFILTPAVNLEEIGHALKNMHDYTLGAALETKTFISRLSMSSQDILAKIRLRLGIQNLPFCKWFPWTSTSEADLVSLLNEAWTNASSNASKCQALNLLEELVKEGYQPAFKVAREIATKGMAESSMTVALSATDLNALLASLPS